MGRNSAKIEAEMRFFMRILRRSAARYPVIDGMASVDLKLRSPRYLFDERDPAPVHKRDLDDEAANYIMTSFREIEDQKHVKLALYFESLDDFKDNTLEIREAVKAHFAFQAQLKRREFRGILNQGFLSLAIGLTFLFICSYISDGAAKPNDLLGSMRYEGFFILAWVSMWRPISAFLYDWWPMRESVVMYRRLSQIDIEIIDASAQRADTKSEARDEIRSELRAEVKVMEPVRRIDENKPGSWRDIAITPSKAGKIAVSTTA